MTTMDAKLSEDEGSVNLQELHIEENGKENENSDAERIQDELSSMVSTSIYVTKSLFCKSKCFFFCDTCSKRNPEAHLNYIFFLYNYYRKDYCMLNKRKDPLKTDMPLIINTHGWVKAGKFWLDEDCDGEVNLIEINSARQDHKNNSVLGQKDTRHLRDSRILAYFRQCYPSSSNFTTLKVPSTEVLYGLYTTIIGLVISSQDFEDLPRCVGLGIVA